MKKIIIVQYNCSHLLEQQLKSIFHFCVEEKYSIALYDNSNDSGHITANRMTMQTLGTRFKNADSDFDFEYHQLRNHGDEHGDYSQSHANALNKAYQDNLNTDVCLFMDHDIFPFRTFGLYTYGYSLAGLMQVKNDIQYMWPGLFLINNKRLAPETREQMDFSPVTELQLDTGGANHNLIKDLYPKYINEYTEQQVEPADLGMYDQWLSKYQIIDKRFMHFGKSSDWYPAADKAERTLKCIEILKQLST